MKVVVASDEKTPLTGEVIKYLKFKNHDLTLMGDLVDTSKKWKWVDIGKEAAELVSKGRVAQAILFCLSGTGICMAANKVKAVRAALCWDAKTAYLARKWDDANVLCLSLRFTTETLAKEILEAWFASQFDEEGLQQAHKLDNL